MNRGYTKRWRKRWDKGYHMDVHLWVMMDYFIDFANYKEKMIFFPNCGMIKLKRGEHIFGYRKVSEFLNMDMSMCVRKIKLLEKIGFMTIQSTNRYSIASIINYDIYQNDNYPDDKPDYVPTYMRSENERKTDDKQTTLPNKEKNIKKEKKVKNTHKACAWPKDFSLTDEKIKYAVDNGIDKKRVVDFFADFEDWARAKGAVYKDWDAAFRNRVRKAREYGKQFLNNPERYEKGAYTSEDAHKRYEEFKRMVNG